MTRHYITDAASLDQSDMKVLHSIHSAGFFSCSTIALMDVINFFNEHKSMPDRFDRFRQYETFKAKPSQDLSSFYFDVDDSVIIDHNGVDIPLPYDCMSIQFAPYKDLPFDHYLPVINKYFHPSQHIQNLAYNLIQKYALNMDNLCAVFYRGNDKAREMQVPTYDEFINKAHEIKSKRPDVRFLVLPDETQFMAAFRSHFPDSLCFDETKGMDKKDSAVFLELPQDKRAEHGAYFFAAVLCLSKCSEVITHSGNGGLWLSLYRGNAYDIHQIFNGQWLN